MKISHLLSGILFLLPLHGAMTVFGFEGIRYWKEVVLLILGLYWVCIEGRNILNKKSVQFSRLELLSLLFLLWGIVLVFLSPDKGTAIQAFRYLGIGYGVFFLVSRLISGGEEGIVTSVQYLVFGSLVSVVFGLWAHFLGGYEILQAWYSNTISSWVPGQSIPLYHETGGFIRMQGTSSGPVEFAHMLFLAVLVLPYARFSRRVRRGIGILLITGILFSLTRAVWIGLAVYGIIILWQKWKWSVRKGSLILGILGLLGIGLLFFVPQLRQQLVERSGTKDHITRPIEVAKIGLQSPIQGSLGMVGPAARAKNLVENNDDKAPIAENVLVDYFAQTGIIGFLIALCFWWKILKLNKKSIQIVVPIILVMNMATIFDMTPLSISYFAILAFLAHISIIDQKKA